MQILPPQGLSPEDWLVEYDSRPTWGPSLPESKFMATVCVRETDDGNTEAVVITSAKLLSEISCPEGDKRRLFFQVPREILYSEGSADGLCDESFDY
jgi:hypothetical protein